MLKLLIYERPGVYSYVSDDLLITFSVSSLTGRVFRNLATFWPDSTIDKQALKPKTWR